MARKAVRSWFNVDTYQSIAPHCPWQNKRTPPCLLQKWAIALCLRRSFALQRRHFHAPIPILSMGNDGSMVSLSVASGTASFMTGITPEDGPGDNIKAPDTGAGSFVCKG